MLAVEARFDYLSLNFTGFKNAGSRYMYIPSFPSSCTIFLFALSSLATISIQNSRRLMHTTYVGTLSPIRYTKITQILLLLAKIITLYTHFSSIFPLLFHPRSLLHFTKISFHIIYYLHLIKFNS